MIDCLIHMVFLGIEVEIFILLLILIRGNLNKRRKKKSHSHQSPPPQDIEHYHDTPAGPMDGARPAEHLSHLSAVPPESDFPQAASNAGESPNMPPDIFSEKDDLAFMDQDDAPSETDELPVRDQLICSIKNLEYSKSYSSEAMLVEQKEGEFLVVILENGKIQAMPLEKCTTERILDDMFSLFFNFSMPTQSDSKKFQIKCEKAALLVRKGQGFCLQSKGCLKLDAV